jgi:hypothetical protein
LVDSERLSAVEKIGAHCFSCEEINLVEIKKQCFNKAEECTLNNYCADNKGCHSNDFFTQYCKGDC